MCHATLRCHAVLAQISLCYPPLEGRLLTRYSPVRRSPLLKSTEVSIKSFPLDLHVLGTPPAFVLSQDQTLSYWLYHSFRVIYLIPRKSNSLISSLTKLLSFRAITLSNPKLLRNFKDLHCSFFKVLIVRYFRAEFHYNID